MPELLLERVNNNFHRLGLDSKGFYAVAYSGGPDSTFLLYSLYQLGFRNIILIYINYHDSPTVDQEEKIVMENAKRFSFKLIKCDLKKPLTKENGNFENEARKLRYRVFALMQKKVHFESLLVAHQQDDHIITYLMQKSRGGLVSHWGIAEKTTIENVKIVRPLLPFTKEEIKGYLDFSKVPYYVDQTNGNMSHVRNWYRENILPSIDRQKTIEEIDTENIRLEGRLTAVKPALGIVTEYSYYYEIPESDRLFLLYSWVNEASEGMKIEPQKITAARNLAFENLKKRNSTDSVDLKCGVSLYRDYEGFYMAHTIEQIPFEHRLPNKTKYVFPEMLLDLSNPSLFNAKDEDFPLTIRSARPDDKFGTGIVNKSVADFLKKHKVPAYLRNFYPVILNKNGKIIFVPFYEDLKSGKLPLELKRYIL
jgi:bifunctional protein TilS/HprT